PCLGRAAGLAPREDAVTAQQHRGRRVRPGPGGADGVLELSPMKLEDGHLNGVAHGGLDLGLALAELECAPRVLLALGEAAVHDCPRRPPHRQIRQIARLAQLAGYLCPRLDLAVRGHHVALLEEADDAKPASEQRELAVGHPLAEAHDLVGDREALLGRLRPPQGDPARTEHGGEIPRVAELPCERDRLLAERQDPLGLRRPVEVDRQAREEPRPKPRIAFAEAIERLLEKLDAGLVDDPAPHPEQTRALPGEAEGAAGQERRVADPSRDLGSLAERLTRPGAVARHPLRAATGEQQLAALARVGRTPFCEDLERALEQDRRVLVRQGRFGVPRGSGAVRERLLHAARPHRPEEVVREGYQVRRRITSRTPSGTGSLGAIDMSRCSRAPSPTSRCTISSTKKGLPSVSRWTARTSAAEALRPVFPSMKSATSSSPKPRSGRCRPS